MHVIYWTEWIDHKYVKYISRGFKYHRAQCTEYGGQESLHTTNLWTLYANRCTSSSTYLTELQRSKIKVSLWSSKVQKSNIWKISKWWHLAWMNKTAYGYPRLLRDHGYQLLHPYQPLLSPSLFIYMAGNPQPWKQMSGRWNKLLYCLNMATWS